MRTGVLLVNLGTPDSARPEDVKRYLLEFLLDPRVVDLPTIKRNFIVRGLIVPKRFKESAANYEKVWSDEGSPLMVYTERLKVLLQEAMGSDFVVEMAMRYQSPSIAKALASLKSRQVEHLIVLPLFPQYASATSGSVLQRVMEDVKEWLVIPKLSFVNSFPDHPSFIEAWRQIGEKYQPQAYDHVLISFHGLPEGQVRKADASGQCLKNGDCCYRKTPENAFCYRAQCMRTAQALTQALDLDQARLTISFQSRLGKMPWLRPYTADIFKELGEKRIERVLVFCPSFVCDCIETTEEIGMTGQEIFRSAGGGDLTLVEGLNTHPAWLAALRKIILDNGGYPVGKAEKITVAF